MFVLVTIEETVRVLPHLFGNGSEVQAIGAELNKRHTNRILPKLGLVICVYDLLSLEDGFVFPGEGAYHAKVEYRLLVFRPFIGEVLTGRIRRLTPDGVQVSIDFFEDIFIPGNRLQPPSQYNEDEKCWVWKYVDDSGVDFDLEMKLEDEIRFRVERIEYQPPPPKKKPFEVTTPRERGDGQTGDGEREPTQHQLSAPMTIHGVANDPGLGLVSWWA